MLRYSYSLCCSSSPHLATSNENRFVSPHGPLFRSFSSITFTFFYGPPWSGLGFSMNITLKILEYIDNKYINNKINNITMFLNKIKIINPNHIILNNISYYKIPYTLQYNHYITYNNNNYSNLSHRLFKLPNPK